MAQITDLAQTYDFNTVNEDFVADGIHSISPTETPLQLILPKMQVSNEKAEWIEQDLTAKVTTIAATYSSQAATMTLAASAATALFPGDTTYRVQIMVGTEILLATGKAGSSAKIKVSHSIGGTTAKDHAVGDKVTILSGGDIEGMDAKKAAVPDRDRIYNYVQTFSQVVETSRIQNRVKQLGGITSEQGHNRGVAAKQIALDLEAQLLHGVFSDTNSGAASSTTARFMKGLMGWLLATATEDSGSVDTAAIETDIQAIWDSGGVPRALICNGKMAQEVANLYSDRIRTEVRETVGGVNITSIENPLGEGPISIVPHRLMPTGRYYLLDTSRIALGFIDAFFIAGVESEASGVKDRIEGDYTLLFQNVGAHRMRYGLS